MNYVGKETTIEVDGKVYTLSRLTRGLMQEYSDWVASQTPDPLATAAEYIAKFPAELQPLLLKQAWADSRRKMDIQSPEVRECMQTVEGGIKMLQLMLRKHHSDLSADDTFEIADKYFQNELKRQVVELRKVKPDLSEDEAEREVLASGPFRGALQAV